MTQVGFDGTEQIVPPSFVNYVDGIYVGYRFWETAAAEGLINYDEAVVYPFGYGLSYTTFTQKWVRSQKLTERSPLMLQ